MVSVGLYGCSDELLSHNLTIIAKHLGLHDMAYICVFQVLRTQRCSCSRWHGWHLWWQCHDWPHACSSGKPHSFQVGLAGRVQGKCHTKQPISSARSYFLSSMEKLRKANSLCLEPGETEVALKQSRPALSPEH